MSNEAQIRSSLFINAQGNAAPLKFQSQPTAFNANLSSSQAPTPGGLVVTVKGIVIDISKITTQPGLAVFQHLGSDVSNYVEIGIYNGVDFFPFIELLAGESWVMRLARNLLQQYAGSATASGLATVSLYAKAALANVNTNALVFPL